MFGCESAATARASRWKRVIASGSVAKLLGSTFTATSRPNRESIALYTSPMPPAPIWVVISYEPSRVPGLSAICCRNFMRWAGGRLPLPNWTADGGFVDSGRGEV